MSTNGVRAFSAPGKALLVGGYLVLNPEYTSYVVALSARMHAVVQQIDRADADNSSADYIQVTVKSEQFNGNQWQYTVKRSAGYTVEEVNDRNNPFIEEALLNVFNYHQPDLNNLPNVTINIYSDPAYHSRANTTVKSNGIKSFLFHKSSITDVPKTGLGSSAGLVTVLVTALISCFEPDFDVSSSKHMKQIHNLAQIAHCQAQGKIGSGFDVAAAVYGSITYNRFDPALIEGLPELSSKNYGSSLKQVVDATDWKVGIDRVSLPPRLRLIMGDVNTGSETTKMVAKVNNWYKKNYPDSLAIYKTIDEANSEFIEGLRQVSNLADTKLSEYEQLIETINDKARTLHPILQRIVDAVAKIRSNFRLITKQSGAEIEPEIQTQLLDSASELPGVLTGIVPGAGGYDAICLISTDSCNIEREAQDTPVFKDVRWLDLTQQDLGIIEERAQTYENIV